MIRVARCNKKPADLCDLARDEDYVELASLSDYGCKNENCGLYFLDDSTPEDSPENAGDDGDRPLPIAPLPGILDKFTNLAMGPVGRIAIFALAILGLAFYLMPKGGQVQEPETSNVDTVTTSCGNLPPVPNESDVSPSPNALAAMKSTPLDYMDCKIAPNIVAWLRMEADKGDEDAALALGDIYNPSLNQSRTTILVALSSKRAYAYYRKALCEGQKDARKRLVELKPYVGNLADSGDNEAINLLSVWNDNSDESSDCAF